MAGRSQLKLRLIAVLLTLLLPIGIGKSASPDSADLVALIRAAGMGKLATRDASVYQDDRSNCLTMTFHYTQGNPEVRVPSEEIGWVSDFSEYRALTFTLESTSVESIFIGFSDGGTSKDEVIEPLKGIRIRGVVPLERTARDRQPIAKVSPLGYKFWPDTLSVPAEVKEISFHMKYPTAPTQVMLCSLSLSKDVPANDMLDRHPVIDRYGQWISEKWEDKAYNDENLKEIWAKEDLREVKYPYCPLGGDPSRKLRSTGFFRTDKVDRRWALIDPHGHPFYSAGIDIVAVADTSFATDVTDRKYLFEELPPAGSAWLSPEKTVSFYAANLARRYGSDWQERGAQHMVERLQNWGFNTIGNWSNKELAAKSRMPYVLPLYGWTTKKTFPYPGLPDVFSEEFKENVDAAARKQCLAQKDDPNLIGWFLENEPAWAHDFDPQLWADAVLNDAGTSAMQTKLKDLLAAKPRDAENIKKQFLFDCVKEYLATIVGAVRKYDPNHLILGVRFAGHPGPQWIKLSSMFDVFSVNVYSESFAPDSKTMKEYSEGSGRPVIIGEFTAAASGRGLEGLFYGVHKVRDYGERGVAYRYFAECSVANPYVVGTHWFQLVDDAPTGRPGDVERLNYGFVNVIDLPYEDLVQAARETHRRLYELMFGKVQPVQRVPRMN